MRSIHEEMAALAEVGLGQHGTTMYKAPDAEADIERHGPLTESERAALRAAPTWSGEPMMAVCLLFRGVPVMRGNRIGRCGDCREPIQWRPSLPKALRPKLCAFCALRRVRGDS